jgi:predicted ATPase
MTPQPRRYVLTGAPGSGKTAILHGLKARGYLVVDEAATDVIARGQALGRDEPWRDPAFVDSIAELQRRRQQAAGGSVSTVQVYDRSPICTLALAHYSGRPVSRSLAAEIDRVVGGHVYERRVFLVRPIGFITRTAARRITFEESLAFERLHELAYSAHGYELVEIPSGAVDDRVAMVDGYIRSWQ